MDYYQDLAQSSPPQSVTRDKRKRSDENENAFSSRPNNESHDAFNFSTMDRALANPYSASSQCLDPSRTMKRFRNSRPSDSEVHQQTLNLLFAAQRQQQQQQQDPASADCEMTPPSAVTQETSPLPQRHGGGGQATLHSFWKLPPSRNTAVVYASPRVDDGALYAPTECEDCGQSLQEADESGDAMDVGGGGGGGGGGLVDATVARCGACGKYVCSHCSITNLGERRRCLLCAGNRALAGGQGRKMTPSAHANFWHFQR